jgi:hypothetical protein
MGRESEVQSDLLVTLGEEAAFAKVQTPGPHPKCAKWRQFTGTSRRSARHYQNRQGDRVKEQMPNPIRNPIPGLGGSDSN